MAKIIRPTYPLEFTIGLLLLIFALSTFLSFEIFTVKWREIIQGRGPIPGMLLSGTAVVIMVVILWEEFFFPVRLKPTNDQIVFRNHFTKLKTQVLMYCAIPFIVFFNYFTYEVQLVPFFIWATICLVSPVTGKLISGIKNYNDFLKLSNETIEYKNNDKQEVLWVKDIVGITLVRDDANVIHKIQVLMVNDRHVTIDLDEMELEPYYQTIDGFFGSHYQALIK